MLANKKNELVDLLIDFEQFEEAIQIAEGGQLEKAKLAQAIYLITNNRLEESLNIFLSLRDQNEKNKALESMMIVARETGKYNLSSRLDYLKNGKTTHVGRYFQMIDNW